MEYGTATECPLRSAAERRTARLKNSAVPCRFSGQRRTKWPFLSPLYFACSTLRTRKRCLWFCTKRVTVWRGRLPKSTIDACALPTVYVNHTKNGSVLYSSCSCSSKWNRTTYLKNRSFCSVALLEQLFSFAGTEQEQCSRSRTTETLITRQGPYRGTAVTACSAFKNRTLYRLKAHVSRPDLCCSPSLAYLHLYVLGFSTFLRFELFLFH